MASRLWTIIISDKCQNRRYPAPGIATLGRFTLPRIVVTSALKESEELRHLSLGPAFKTRFGDQTEIERELETRVHDGFLVSRFRVPRDGGDSVAVYQRMPG